MLQETAVKMHACRKASQRGGAVSRHKRPREAVSTGSKPAVRSKEEMMCKRVAANGTIRDAWAKSIYRYRFFNVLDSWAVTGAFRLQDARAKLHARQMRKVRGRLPECECLICSRCWCFTRTTILNGCATSIHGLWDDTRMASKTCVPMLWVD